MLAFVHDVPWLLGRLKTAADRLILTYRCLPEGDLFARRAAGYVNDYTENRLRDLLSGAGWRIEDSKTDGDVTLIVAR